jgi:predicted nucleic acid-binding protein
LLLDTSAWIEFFIGSPEGRQVRKVLEEQDCYTSMGSLAEITDWAIKEEADALYLIKTVKQLSTIIVIDEDIAVLAGRLNNERKKTVKKWGMLDSFILATGTLYGLKILTKDRDFRDLPDVTIL